MNKCKYCREEHTIQGDWTELHFDLPNRMISAWGDGEATLVDVNYCPMCGRKLVPDVKED